MPGPDLSLPPKPPVPNFNSPVSSSVPRKPLTASQPQYSTPSRSAVSFDSRNPTRYLVPVPFPTPETYRLSPSPSLSNQTPLSFTPLQGLPSPSVLPLGGVTALRNITPSPQFQSPTNGAVAQRRRQRKRDPRMLPSARSPSDRSPRPRPTGKPPPWRTNRRRAYVNPNPFQTPEQTRTPLENMSEYHKSPDEPIRSTNLQDHADRISLLRAEDTEAVNATQQQESSRSGTDPIRQLFDLYLDNGVNYLNDEEQELLCRYIDPGKEDQRDLVYRVTEQILWYNRKPSLTYRLANWIYTRDSNHEVIFRLLCERLNLPDPEEGKAMMSLEEVNELMDCQIAVDAYKKWREEEKNPEEQKGGKEHEFRLDFLRR
ncbi:uncharacterized protein F4817DRAFT_320706 [Daldinia loculata]|uniref:uncharacterized protein n=1 Tax=Daldinia loculata TaxID=103429 RepID=UPI0020C2E209|nr:uncharacterized protein F4817DRAFT_320706 [Daldinia loculata]KAI1642514.1 hypothetical protein F4817DRAFT_320706 [Daldinia loculata]